MAQKQKQAARSEEHTSELQSHHPSSYAVVCLKKKNKSRGNRQYHWPKEPARGLVSDRPVSYAGVRSPRGTHGCSDRFFFHDTATTEIYTGWYTLSLHDALPISHGLEQLGARDHTRGAGGPPAPRVRSEEHTSELQSHHPISYAVFCLKKKN